VETRLHAALYRIKSPTQRAAAEQVLRAAQSLLPPKAGLLFRRWRSAQATLRG